MEQFQSTITREIEQARYWARNSELLPVHQLYVTAILMNEPSLTVTGPEIVPASVYARRYGIRHDLDTDRETPRLILWTEVSTT